MQQWGAMAVETSLHSICPVKTKSQKEKTIYLMKKLSHPDSFKFSVYSFPFLIKSSETICPSKEL